MEKVHRFTEVAHVTAVIQVMSMNWYQKNVEMYIPGRYQLQGGCFAKNENVMCGKEIILRTKNGDTGPSATILIENSTISNLYFKNCKGHVYLVRRGMSKVI